ncbi:hypothetical protein PR048_010431 [Dryococelus australis]|uniref:Uncharacterized protein n=1 Tax=Dryococelus australis TaxID=614101 RepID=A0ABQ9I2S5_9NEOP|nr:hypothetical protein PR048_010431 [Dryococelus australis]
MELFRKLGFQGKSPSGVGVERVHGQGHIPLDKRSRVGDAYSRARPDLHPCIQPSTLAAGSALQWMLAYRSYCNLSDIFQTQRAARSLNKPEVSSRGCGVGSAPSSPPWSPQFESSRVGNTADIAKLGEHVQHQARLHAYELVGKIVPCVAGFREEIWHGKMCKAIGRDRDDLRDVVFSVNTRPGIFVRGNLARTMISLAGGVSREFPLSPRPWHSGASPYSPHFTLKYNYCRLVTKVAKHLARNDQGKNALANACKEHNIVYVRSNNLKERHTADTIIADKAANIRKNPYTSTGEKLGA